MPCASALALRLALAAALLVAGLPAAHADGAALTSLCHADEAVAFSCRLGPRTVSLCLRGEAGQTGAISFRLGSAGKLEREFVASAQTGQHFSANVTPSQPGALVRQLWFDQGGRRTLLTECVGGNCAQAAGMAVLRAGKLVSKQRCQRTPDDAAWFSRQLVNFGNDVDSSQSKSPLLLIEDIDNPIELIYPPRQRR